MGRFQRSERGGEADPQEALRRAREAVARERAARGEDHNTDEPREGVDEERVEEAMRERDERGEDN
jgi:hypothetical protein